MKTGLRILSETLPLVSVLTNFKQLTKAGLSLSVVFSSVAGYFLGASNISIATLGLLITGGYFTVGASNVFNQILEKDLDALMKRTANRPLPTARVSTAQAFILGVLLSVAGLTLLYLINPKTAFFGALSVFLYTAVYTPLKTKTSLAVFAGAFPGAIPFMLGWVAATGKFGIEPGILFMMQFFWQFPHFWAIGWMLDSDYKKAGFKMLPTGNKDSGTAIQIVMYTLWTVLISLVPAFGFTGALSLTGIGVVLVSLAGLFLLIMAVQLYRKRSNQAARRLMLASIIWLTLIQLIYVFDKWYN